MKSWQPLTKQPSEGYNQVSSGEGHGGNTGGKFVPGAPSEGYNTNTSGESHSSMKGSKFCGPTKGNKDLPPNRSTGVNNGGYRGE